MRTEAHSKIKSTPRLLPVVCKTEVVNSMNSCDIKLLITLSRSEGEVVEHSRHQTALKPSYLCLWLRLRVP